MPITWRNVNGPSFNGVSESLARAGQSFTGAVDALQQTKDTFETGRTDRNTQAFMDQLSKYGSPDELAAAQESGAVADLRGQFGSLLDTNKTSADAVTGRIGTLRDRETADFNYEQQGLERAEQPYIGEFNSRINAAQAGADTQKDFEQIRTDLQARVESGDIRASTAANLLSTAGQRQNTLTERHRSNITWGEGREAKRLSKSANSAVNAAVDAYDPLDPNSTATAGLAAMRKALPKGLTATQRAEAEASYNALTQSKGKVAAADQPLVDAASSQVISKYGLESNVFHNNDLSQANENITAIRDKHTRTNEDGKPQFLGVSSGKKRTEAINTLRRLGTTGVDILGDGNKVPIPTTTLDDVVSGLEDDGYIYDSVAGLEEAVSEVVNNEDFIRQYDNYQKGKGELNAVRTGAFRNVMDLSRGEGQPQQNPPEPAAQSQPESGGGVPYPLRPNPGTEGLPTSVSSALAALTSAGVPPGTPLPQKGQEPVPVEAPYSQPFLQTPIRKLPGQFKDWFNETVNANAVESGKRGAEVLRSLMDQRTPIPEIEMRERLTTNPFALKQLDAKELNKLRDIYGESFINQFIK